MEGHQEMVYKLQGNSICLSGQSPLKICKQHLWQHRLDVLIIPLRPIDRNTFIMLNVN